MDSSALENISEMRCIDIARSKFSRDEKRRATEMVMFFVITENEFFPKDLHKLIPFWEGDLERKGRFIYSKVLEWNSPKFHALELLRKYKDPLPGFYSRDFYEGVIDAACVKRKRNRNAPSIMFRGRKHLRDFFDRKDLGVTIPFLPDNPKDHTRNETAALFFLEIPCRNNAVDYFAGLLTGSVPIEIDGELWCRVNKVNEVLLKKLNIPYHKHSRYYIISPFYMMLFCGDIPEDIFAFWMPKLAVSPQKIGQGIELPLMYYKAIYGKDTVKRGFLPYLMHRKYYNLNVVMPISEVKKLNDQRRFGHVDRRIKERAYRWRDMALLNGRGKF
jgi:hypothetical protein